MGSRDDHPRQVSCWITHTSERTHEIIRGALHRSPLYSGQIEGIGPRYCPSIEDKVVRFAEKASHQIFVEPEGLDVAEIYPNGISTSLPFDVQLELVRSIRGFEHAHITRAGYAIEYDFFDPRGLKASLETKAVAGLFFAGQINGTTGYEEAAAQGLIAGLNAARYVQAARRVVAAPRRGLHRRADRRPDHPRHERAVPHVHLARRIPAAAARGQRRPAPDRHRPRARPGRRRALGALRDQARGDRTRDRAPGVARGRRRATRSAANSTRTLGIALTRETNALDLLKRPELDYAQLMALPSLAPGVDDPAVAEQVEIGVKYSGYLDRQRDEIARQQRHEDTRDPGRFDYAGRARPVGGSAAEARARAPADRRPGAAHPGHDAGGDFAAARAPRARSGASAWPDACTPSTARRICRHAVPT